MKEKTIIALSSAHGSGAISVIRLSGEESVEMLGKLFKTKNNTEDRKALYGVIDTGTVKDDVVAVIYFAPASYTGENVAEIFCHGSPVIVENIIRAFIKLGARQAEKGEFTRRALENNKLGLTEAEGIIDLIDAQSESAVKAAYNLAGGKLAEKIAELKEKTTAITAELNVALDYPEEDLEVETIEQCGKKCEQIIEEAEKLAKTYENGKKAKDGVNVVIVGKPNEGKSTLLNALVGYDRAIVTDEAGTTRDTVEESYIYEGVRFNVTDTAGIRKEASGEAERLGIERSVTAAKSADVIITLDETMAERKNAIKVQTKADLGLKSEEKINVSGKTKEGIEELKRKIFEEADTDTSGEVMLTNLRQYESLVRAIEALKYALSSVREKREPELITVDLLEAISALGSVDGATATADVVNAVFSRFCVGK